MANQPEAQEEVNNLAELKAQLEIEKLQLEIEKVKKPVLLQPGFLAPITVALIGILTAYLAGWFGLKKEVLKLDVEKMENQKQLLQAELDDLRQETKVVTHSFGLLRREQATLESLATGAPSGREVVSGFLDGWNQSGLETPREYYESLAGMKWGFASDYNVQTREASEFLLSNPLVDATGALTANRIPKPQALWFFWTTMRKEYPNVMGFVLLWARTPKEIILEDWKEFPEILSENTAVSVATPFSQFFSPASLQDEDLWAICTTQGSDKTLQEDLIERGLAVYYQGESSAPWELHQKLEAAQVGAAKARVGFWGTHSKEMKALAEEQPEFVW